MHKAYNAPSTNFIMALISSCSDLVVVTAIWILLPCPDQYRRGCGKSATGAFFIPASRPVPSFTLHPSPFTLHPCSLRQRSGNTKPKVAVTGADVLVAVRGAHVDLLVFAPRAAAVRALRAVAFQIGAAIERRAAPLQACREAVFGPLTDVAQHVIKPESIGLERASRRSLCIAIITRQAFVAGIVVLVCGLVVYVRKCADPVGRQAPETISAFRSRPCGVLPFGFREKAIFLAGLAREPLGVAHCLIPGNIDCRPAPSAPALVLDFRTLFLRRAGIPFVESHLELADRKGFAEAHGTHRAFLVEAPRVAGRIA